MRAAEKKIDEHKATLAKLKSEHNGMKRKFNNLEKETTEKMESKKRRKNENIEKKERNNKKEANCFISTEKLKKCPLCNRKLTLKFSVKDYKDNTDCPCGITIKILWDPEVPEGDEEGQLQ